MRVAPLSIGPIHFVGIGGIGMSGIAEILHLSGYKVQGSDNSSNQNTKRLADLGIKVFAGHHQDNLGDADVVVVSSAIPPDNAELLEARMRRVPVVRRADMLAELMWLNPCVAVAGTHGKTTTTAIVAALFDKGNLDPTVINGGIINAYGTNARKGSGEWMVVEADESDGSFLRLPATIGIVTNIDPEHMEHYGSYERLQEAFFTFIERLPFYGLAVLCTDHPAVQSLFAEVTDRRTITYGFNPQADLQALNVRLDPNGAVFDVRMNHHRGGSQEIWQDLRLSLPGNHNVLNALSAIAVCLELKLTETVIRSALSGLKGVKRRFSITGKVGGLVIVDDYAHHPVEIEAVLKTARAAASGGRVIAVMQPHRYSRLHDLFDQFCRCFSEADLVVLAPVFAAGEKPIGDTDHLKLSQGLTQFGQREVMTIAGSGELAPLIHKVSREGDLVICMGAGSITKWANSLPEELMELRS